MTTKNLLVTSGTADEIKKFSYRARNSDGLEVSGTAMAVTATAVTHELLDKGLIPLHVAAQRSGLTLRGDIQLRKTVKLRSLVIASRQLAAMFRAGLPYTEALHIAAADCEDKVLRNGLNEARIAINNGSSIADAMAAQPEAFPATAVHLIRAGEKSGTVVEAMEQVAAQFASEDELRAQIKKAMIFPVVLLVAVAAVLVLMGVFLIPRFTVALEGIAGEGAQLPFLTRAVMTVTQGALFGLPVLAGLAFWARSWLHKHRDDEKVRDVLDPLKLRIPVMGKLFHKIALARFTRNLSSLMAAGVDRIEALGICAETVGNVQMKRAILKAREAQRNGSSLTVPLRAEPLFSQAVVSLIEAGEQSGTTATMLGNAAEMCERDSREMSAKLSALLEPLMIVVLAVVIGVVAMALYLPYLSMTTAF